MNDLRLLQRRAQLVCELDSINAVFLSQLLRRCWRAHPDCVFGRQARRKQRRDAGRHVQRAVEAWLTNTKQVGEEAFLAEKVFVIRLVPHGGRPTLQEDDAEETVAMQRGAQLRPVLCVHGHRHRVRALPHAPEHAAASHRAALFGMQVVTLTPRGTRVTANVITQNRTFRRVAKRIQSP